MLLNAARYRFVWAGLAVGAVTTDRASALAGDEKIIRYGEHLSQECTSCHRRDGVDNGIPSLLGMRPADFRETLKYYQSGARENPAMVSVAQSLDDDQITALATYFATLPRPARTSSASASGDGNSK
jgi:cytochrome c553